jgi:hypothetical protein
MLAAESTLPAEETMSGMRMQLPPFASWWQHMPRPGIGKGMHGRTEANEEEGAMIMGRNEGKMEV